jgi:hypothetical protein
MIVERRLARKTERTSHASRARWERGRRWGLESRTTGRSIRGYSRLALTLTLSRRERGLIRLALTLITLSQQERGLIRDISQREGIFVGLS